MSIASSFGLRPNLRLRMTAWSILPAQSLAGSIPHIHVLLCPVLLLSEVGRRPSRIVTLQMSECVDPETSQQIATARGTSKHASERIFLCSTLNVRWQELCERNGWEPVTNTGLDRCPTCSAGGSTDMNYVNKGKPELSTHAKNRGQPTAQCLT